MYVYIYIYIYIYTYVCVYIISLSLSLYIYIYIYIHTRIGVTYMTGNTYFTTAANSCARKRNGRPAANCARCALSKCSLVQ